MVNPYPGMPAAPQQNPGTVPQPGAPWGAPQPIPGQAPQPVPGTAPQAGSPWGTVQPSEPWGQPDSRYATTPGSGRRIGIGIATAIGVVSAAAANVAEWWVVSVRWMFWGGSALPLHIAIGLCTITALVGTAIATRRVTAPTARTVAALGTGGLFMLGFAPVVHLLVWDPFSDFFEAGKWLIVLAFAAILIAVVAQLMPTERSGSTARAQTPIQWPHPQTPVLNFDHGTPAQPGVPTPAFPQAAVGQAGYPGQPAGTEGPVRQSTRA